MITKFASGQNSRIRNRMITKFASGQKVKDPLRLRSETFLEDVHSVQNNTLYAYAIRQHRAQDHGSFENNNSNKSLTWSHLVKLDLKGQSNEIFYLQFFSYFKPTWATD